MVWFYFIRAYVFAANVESTDWRLPEIDDKAWFAVLVPLNLEDVHCFAVRAPKDSEQRITGLVAHEPATLDKWVKALMYGLSQGSRT